jgi:hypothetical protein
MTVGPECFGPDVIKKPPSGGFFSACSFMPRETLIYPRPGSYRPVIAR